MNKQFSFSSILYELQEIFDMHFIAQSLLLSVKSNSESDLLIPLAKSIPACAIKIDDYNYMN